MLPVAAKTVSYTHLDVYKRQVDECAWVVLFYDLYIAEALFKIPEKREFRNFSEQQKLD